MFCKNSTCKNSAILRRWTVYWKDVTSLFLSYQPFKMSLIQDCPNLALVILEGTYCSTVLWILSFNDNNDWSTDTFAVYLFWLCHNLLSSAGRFFFSDPSASMRCCSPTFCCQLFTQCSCVYSSLLKVLDNLATLIDGVSNLPPTLKARILHLMQKRGLVSDGNLPKVCLHVGLEISYWHLT